MTIEPMTTKPNIYIDPNAPTWLKRMLLEEIFRSASIVSHEEMQATIDERVADASNGVQYDTE
jgi:hypothetical protein